MKSIFQSNQKTKRHRQPDQQQEPATPFFQPKLTINPPNDKYEKEADHVADKVVNQTGSSQPAIQRLATPDEEKMPSTNAGRMEEDRMIQEKPIIQRAAAAPPDKEKEKPIQKMDAPKEEEKKPIQTAKSEDEEPLQAKSEIGAATASPNFNSRLTARKGGGAPLPDSTRQQMEQGIGADFGKVRIHTDSEAVAMNKEIRAQAFTHGQDVYFNAGKFSPAGKDGQRLLAHELTHVVQQNGRNQSTIQRSADNCAWGEIREWAVNNDPPNYTAPAGLGDVKESIYAACNRNTQGLSSCACGSSGANATAKGDQAAWKNIQAATGTDLSNGANYICVGNQNCGIVHQCRPYHQHGQARPPLRARTQNLQPVATLTLKGNTIYFYSDTKNGNCPPEPKKDKKETAK